MSDQSDESSSGEGSSGVTTLDPMYQRKMSRVIKIINDDQTMHMAQTESQPLPAKKEKDRRKWPRRTEGVDCDEVIANLIVGNLESGTNKEFLKHAGVGHIVFCGPAQAGRVRPEKHWYCSRLKTLVTFKDLGPNVTEDKFGDHFESVANHVDKALRKCSAGGSGGRVLLFCWDGTTWAPVMAIAFLVLRRDYSLEEAFLELRKCRPITARTSLLHQLLVLDSQVSAARHSDQPESTDITEEKLRKIKSELIDKLGL